MCLEWKGTDILQRLVNLVGPETQRRLALKNTAQEMSGMLYESYATAAPFSLPSLLIAPFRFLWASQESLWMWVHPCVLVQVKEALSSRTSESQQQLDAHYEVVQLNRLELRGARCHALVQVLLDVCDSSQRSSTVWKQLASLRLSSCLTPGAVLSLDVWDPRLRFPVKMPPRPKETLDSDELRELTARWPRDVSQSRLMSADQRKSINERMQTQGDINTRKSKVSTEFYAR